MISCWRVSFFETWFQYFFCSGKTSQTWFYSASSNWTMGPELIEPRFRCGCAKFWLDGEQIIVVSPGLGSSDNATEFLNLSQENPQWTQGTFSHSSNLIFEKFQMSLNFHFRSKFAWYLLWLCTSNGIQWWHSLLHQHWWQHFPTFEVHFTPRLSLDHHGAKIRNSKKWQTSCKSSSWWISQM